MPRLHLVRHARPVVDPAVPAHAWVLHPDAAAETRALRTRLPGTARWFASTEPKAAGTAHLLTSATVTLVDGLREAARPAVWFDDPEEFRALVRRAFAAPDVPAYPGWEPLSQTRRRVVEEVRRILDGCADDDVVLVGHGTAWTLLTAELTGTDPDVDAWARMRMPDHCVLDLP